VARRRDMWDTAPMVMFPDRRRDASFYIAENLPLIGPPPPLLCQFRSVVEHSCPADLRTPWLRFSNVLM
jgi:hypothetical protein